MVVGAAAQAGDAVLDAVAGGEQEDRGFAPGGYGCAGVMS
jgi:hypothetical protein